MARNDELGALKPLLAAACLVIVVAALKAARPILVPLLLAAFLAALAAPIVLWLGKRRVAPSLSIPLIVVAALLGLSVVGGFVGTSVNRFVGELPRYQARLDALFGGVLERLRSQDLVPSIDSLREAVSPGHVMGFVGTTLSQLAEVVSDTLLVLLTVVFLLFEVTGLPRKLRVALGDPNADLSRFRKVANEVKSYVLIKTYVSLGTGALVALLLLALGVDFPLMWGLVAFLLNYIPNIGSVIAALPAVLLALVQLGPGHALGTAAGFVAINMLVGNVIEPQLMGRRLGLSTLVVFVSLVFWGWLWGAAGMLLSVPLTMIVKILLENSPSLAWVGALMDPASSEETKGAANELGRARGS